MISSENEASSAHLWLMSDIIDIVKPSINLPSQLLHTALHRAYEHDKGIIVLSKSRGEYKWAGVNKTNTSPDQLKHEVPFATLMQISSLASWQK